ncbi:MAG: hypothetical protein IT276_02265 [Ignavibacteriaceae bacterium]|nr:hypothetical protein [Ignavibacterium sp.]MCC6253716.1 hypothetical protein [Ignavibacteriaceae bacterium]HMN26217.1 hypothetical protein [Ignavibacteriaceae bacterium]HRN25431.1 hypothetical protein [Ignavibacteriaceae bacterium]HRP91585.1 hypothetical protein [Ignavibacteriaceae bacterium]
MVEKEIYHSYEMIQPETIYVRLYNPDDELPKIIQTNINVKNREPLIDEFDLTVDTYFFEITLELGSRIVVELGKSDKNRKFRIKNNFWKFKKVEIYTNLDL